MKIANRYSAVGFILSIFIVMLIVSSPVLAGTDFFSHLKLTEVSVKGHKLHIRGETDLPNGSMLNIHVGIPGLSGKHGKGGKVKVHVNSHRFFVQVDLPKKGDWHGRFAQFKVIFKPHEQGPKIRARVGAKGEKLKGAKVKMDNGNKYLEENRLLILE